jgi:hypothetical protein
VENSRILAIYSCVANFLQIFKNIETKQHDNRITYQEINGIREGACIDFSKG